MLNNFTDKQLPLNAMPPMGPVRISGKGDEGDSGETPLLISYICSVMRCGYPILC